MWQHRDETWKSFSHSPWHCLGKQQARWIYFVPPLSVPALFLVAKLSSGDRWYFKSQEQSRVTFFRGCYSFPILQIHLFPSNFSGIIVKNAQDSFTVLVTVWRRLCHLCRTTVAFTSLWSVIRDSKWILLLNWRQQLEKHSTDPAGSCPVCKLVLSLLFH